MQKISAFIKSNIEIIVSGILAAIIFVLLYGFGVLIPSNTDYLKIGGDLSQHYYGWELFREGSWRLFFGKTDTMAYPYSTSVIFTDSIPLFAVVFKLILCKYNGPFQYFGIWGIMCFILQGVFSAKLLRRRVPSNIKYSSFITVSLSLLFILCPFFIRRMFWHCALSAHFLILISFDLFDNTIKLSRTRLCHYWIILGILCSFIHLYFLAMVGPVLFASCIYRFLYNRKIKCDKQTLLLDFVTPLLGFVFFSWYTIFILGGFNSNMSGGAPGLGYYSFNLNGFFNPDDGYGIILKQLPHFEAGQYEGNAYLGFGALILILISIICAVILLFKKGRSIEASDSSASSPAYYLSAALFCFILLILAASNEVTVNNILLFKLPISGIIEKLYSPFRSSGRLIWPVGYMLMLMAVRIILSARINFPDFKNHSGYKALIIPALFILLISIQFYDMSVKLHQIHNDFKEEKTFTNHIYDNSELLNDLIDKLEPVDEHCHLVFMSKNTLSQQELYEFTDIAIRNHMTINDFYFARNFNNIGQKIALEYANEGRRDCLFVFKEDEYVDYFDLPLTFYKENGYVYALAK